MKMKKIFMTMLVALMALTATQAQAQKLAEEEREHVIGNLIGRMTQYGDWYITPTPITWYEYWAVTGMKRHPKGTSVSRAAIVQDNEQSLFCSTLNKEAGRQFFVLMSKSEALQAFMKKKLHDDVSYESYDHGFYVKMSKKNMQYLGR